MRPSQCSRTYLCSVIAPDVVYKVNDITIELNQWNITMYFQCILTWLFCALDNWISPSFLGRDCYCLAKGKVRKEMPKLPVPMSHRLRFSYGKEPEDAYLRDLRVLRVFQREGTIASFLRSLTLLEAKIEQICSCFSALFVTEALLVCFFT